MLLISDSKHTHKVLVTFIAEVAAIIIAKPLVLLSTDPNDSFIFTPAARLTQTPVNEFQISTSISGGQGQYLTPMVPSGTDEGSNSFQDYRHVENTGAPDRQTDRPARPAAWTGGEPVCTPSGSQGSQAPPLPPWPLDTESSGGRSASQGCFCPAEPGRTFLMSIKNVSAEGKEMKK
ncbi:hypothetical protein N1851_014142 [Merluccius polli]|uniref:Uncharacterized protein n=1 Tax=Merluccius polli TaxID=89951 RepID=A0AA47MUR7_MERPO|nr:hypothetical protein N1851_014142 [Merluccius polli]